MTQVVAPRRRGAKLGVWALIVALFPFLYVGLGLIAGLLGQGQSGNDALATVAYVMFFLAFVVIPISFVVVLVLGIVALMVDRRLGKILGAIGLAILLAAIVVIVVFLSGSGSPLNWTNF